MKNILFLLCLFLLFQSCSNKLYERVEGIWSIDEMYYQEENIMFNFLSNIIIFKEEGVCSLPIVYRNDPERGSWEVHKKDRIAYLNVQSKNEFFAKQYVVNFERDPKARVLRMILVSGDLYIKCTKGLYNYELDESW